MPSASATTESPRGALAIRPAEATATPDPDATFVQFIRELDTLMPQTAFEPPLAGPGVVTR
jgi:hypothetical protein